MRRFTKIDRPVSVAPRRMSAAFWTAVCHQQRRVPGPGDRSDANRAAQHRAPAAVALTASMPVMPREPSASQIAAHIGPPNSRPRSESAGSTQCRVCAWHSLGQRSLLNSRDGGSEYRHRAEGCDSCQKPTAVRTVRGLNGVAYAAIRGSYTSPLVATCITLVRIAQPCSTVSATSNAGVARQRQLSAFLLPATV